MPNNFVQVLDSNLDWTFISGVGWSVHTEVHSFLSDNASLDKSHIFISQM